MLLFNNWKHCQNGENAFYMAVVNGYIEMALELSDPANIDVEFQNSENQTVLHGAVSWHSTVMVFPLSLMVLSVTTNLTNGAMYPYV